MNTIHPDRTDEWYTPVPILELARRVLGVIEFDPASDDFGNKRVKAKVFHTREQDGLRQAWPNQMAMWINPPAGLRDGKSLSIMFWKRLMFEREYDFKNFVGAIFMGFSVELLQSSQGKDCLSMMDFPFCVPSKRIQFDSADGRPNTQPGHSNVIVYVPGSCNETNAFLHVFSELGVVCPGSGAYLERDNFVPLLRSDDD